MGGISKGIPEETAAGIPKENLGMLGLFLDGIPAIISESTRCGPRQSEASFMFLYKSEPS